MPGIHVNMGLSPCYKLKATHDTAETVEACLSSDGDNHDNQEVKVVISLAEEDNEDHWLLETARLWVGDNITKVSSIQQTPGEPSLLLQAKSIASKTTQFTLPLLDKLDFSCPDEGRLFWMSLNVTGTNENSNETIHWNLVHHKDNVFPQTSHVTSFALSCHAVDVADELTPPVQLQSPFSKTNQQHRRGQDNCPALYPAPEDIVLSLTKPFMRRANYTLGLSTLANRGVSGPIEDNIEEQRKLWEFFDGWSDIDDQTVVAKPFDMDVCFAVFSSVQGINPFDQWQNINPFTIQIPNTNCIVRRGFWAAYKSIKFYTKFRAALNKCLAICDGGCDMIFGGHSQGGAAAIVASIDLIELDPIEIITFGNPRAIVRSQKCTAPDPSRYFRFLNTNIGRRYDYAPFQINIFNERHIGTPMLLDDVNFPLSSPLDDNSCRFPCDLDLHEREIYLERVTAMLTRDCWPIPVARWTAGHYCSYDDECQSLQCQQRSCRDGIR
ncbi:expressed unknown protein [Seminavis robusta]|uniref:Fungal lipase-type domain-containing protein n=1 Tax=Seminavis robusta TaxID=568900 RepID=A0A9N8EFI8_9STRA|nr:expressed unknown protein [Seminavis robusta]|eukprot:Sro1078_g238780.1 n/a (496) ;mRNA; f:21633-23504